MYELDLKLDRDGNTLIENGDFQMTTDDSDFITQMLMTSPGSWRFHEGMGVGLANFVGMLATDITIGDIKTRINTFFKGFGLYPEMLLYYVNDSTLSAQLTFSLLGKLNKLDLSLLFDITSGVITFTDINPELQTVQNTMTTNKYLNRRG